MLRNLGLSPASRPGTNYDSTILADSPVGYWPLNESTGTTATDHSGNGNNGTYTGGFTLAQTGIGDGETSVSLNGSTGYVSVAGSSVLALGSAFTLEGWLNMPSLATDFPLFTFSGSFLFDLLNCNEVRYYGPPGSQNFNSSAVAGNTNVWQYVTARYNGSTITLRLGTTDVATASATGSLSSGTSWVFGYYAANSWFALGRIAKFAIYNYALTSTQLSNHYTAQSLSGGAAARASGIAVSAAVSRASLI